MVVDYYWLDGLLIAQKIGPKYTIFIYDDTGSPYGFVYDNTYYYYVKNMQGDIIGILDADGNIIVRYEYSAWGEILSITGSHASTIGQKNPLRYRGYYYDDETGFYYLQSRYYDPVTCRFINADGVIAGVSSSTNGYNLFSYCFNNPVNMTDDTGSWPTWNDIKAGFKKAVNWVKDTIVTPVKNFVNDVKSDIKNFDKDNKDEQKVLKANYISTYNGALVVKPPIGNNAFSYGVLVIGDGVRKTYDIQHEYGHYRQLKEIGIIKYTKYVAIPSVRGYWNDVDNYYSQPWEYGADLLGGVDPNVRNYTSNAEEEYKIYWDKVTQ